MAEPYTFEYEGVEVRYFPAVVRTHLEKRRIHRKLLEAYGYLGTPTIPDDEFDDMEEYSSAMSQCKTTAAWWVSSNASPERVREAYELFLEQDTDLFAEFLHANSVTRPAKKTIMTTSQT